MRAAGPPDIVLVTVDTLRADHLGVYGYPRATSPELDRFADESMLFENCLSHAPHTVPSFGSLFTGYLPHETHMDERSELPPGVRTLAERLREGGYQTIGINSNYVLSGRWGWSQGFDVYDDEMEDHERIRHWPERIAEHTTDRAIELLDTAGPGPLFLWVHYQDPHGPYTSPDSFASLFVDAEQKPRILHANRSVSGQGGIPLHQRLGDERDYHVYVARYDGEIRYWDAQLGRLLEALRQRGLYDEAFIVLTADHGEAMGERDYYFAHIEHLYHALTHVPLILHHGEALRGRRRGFVQHLDLMPTLLQVADIEPEPALRGRDLLAPEAEAPREIYASLAKPVPRFSLVVDGVKLVYTPSSGRTELFDLRRDPDERRDLAQAPARAAQRADLLARLARVRAEDRLGVEPQPEAPLSPEERQQLESLGYLR